MAALTMRQILEDSRRFVQQKQAEYKAGMAGQDPSSMPGSENDKPAPSVKSDKEVKQDLPPGGTSAAGAADADKLECGHNLDVTQKGNIVPDKQPAESADAMAEPKTGSAKLANDLLASIRALQTAMSKTAAEGKCDSSSCDSSCAPCKPAEGKPADGDGKKPEPAPENAKKEPETKSEDKKAEDVPVTTIDLTQDVLAKIAAVILSTDAGFEYTEQALTKAAGAEAAREVLATLQNQVVEEEKQAAAAQGYADAQALILKAAEMAGYEKAAADLSLANQSADLEKQAVDQAAIQGYNDATALIVKLAQDAGLDPAALEALAGQEAGAGDMGAGDMGAGAADEALAAMGTEPTGDEEISEEELAQALSELVQEGEIQPEDAEAIIQYIGNASNAEEAGAAESAPETETETETEEPAAEETNEEADNKAASARPATIASLMETIKEAKARRDSATKTKKK